MVSSIDPTGRQVRLSRGDVTAHIAQVGASLRGLVVRGHDVVAAYPLGEVSPQASGIVLAPWPNRVRDGRWRQTDPQGTSHDEQLALTEPRLGNASHGLLRFAAYDIEEAGDRAVLRARVVPQMGYPFALDTSVRYALTDDGIDVVHEIENIGSAPAPVALGTHPYFRLSGVATGDLEIVVPGETFFELDDRLLPIAERPVPDDVDLRAGRRLGDLDLDGAYGSLDRDADGWARSTLTAPDGRIITVRQDGDFGFVQVFTSDGHPGGAAVAIEPMTAPADALNSGQGLRWLAPGETWRVGWGVTLTGDDGAPGAG